MQVGLEGCLQNTWAHRIPPQRLYRLLNGRHTFSNLLRQVESGMMSVLEFFSSPSSLRVLTATTDCLCYIIRELQFILYRVSRGSSHQPHPQICHLDRAGCVPGTGIRRYTARRTWLKYTYVRKFSYSCEVQKVAWDGPVVVASSSFHCSSPSSALAFDSEGSSP